MQVLYNSKTKQKCDHDINKLKKKFSQKTQNNYHKIPQPLRIKKEITLSKQGIEGNFLKLVKKI